MHVRGVLFAVKNLGSFGVCDHSYFLNNKVAARNSGYSSSAALKGISPPPWGWDLSKYFVFEDDVFELVNWAIDTYMMDTEYPVNYMVRHCTFNLNRAGAFVADGFDMHGNAGSSLNDLGLVIYSNTFNYTGINTVNPCRLTDIRGGRFSLVYDNVINGVDIYTTLRDDPFQLPLLTDTYLWNNVGRNSDAMAFDIHNGLVENTNYFLHPPGNFAGFTYPHPLVTANSTPSPTPPPSPSPTATATATRTPAPTATATATATSTMTPTATIAPSPTPTATRRLQRQLQLLRLVWWERMDSMRGAGRW